MTHRALGTFISTVFYTLSPAHLQRPCGPRFFYHPHSTDEEVEAQRG